jgi:hypothetical protein
VAGLQAIVLLIVVPFVAWLIALLSLQSARADLVREGPPGASSELSQSRILLHAGYSGMPILFGVILFFLARPALNVIDGFGTGTVVRLEPVLVWGAFAYAVASCSTLAAQTWIVRTRLRAFLGPRFGRVLPLSALPTTAVIFALVLLLLFLGFTDSVLSGGPAASDSALASAVASFQAFAVGTIAFPVAAGFSNRVRDLSQRGFVRAILIMDIGELPVLVGLVQGFLALRAL